MEGWRVYTENGGVATLEMGTTTGATLHDLSLHVTTPESWWNEMLIIDLAQMEGGREAFFDNDTFSIDITRLVSEWTDRGYWWGNDHSIALILNPSDVYGDTNWWNLGFQGSWGNAVWSGFDGDKTMTLTWDYSAYKSLIRPDTTELKLILRDHYMNYSPGGSMYLDNARLCPVPCP